MARFVDAIDLPISVEEAFDYLADFSRTAEWDSSVVAARRLSRGEIGLGSRFEVVVSLLGRETTLEYEITEYSRPHRLVMAGGNESLDSVDEISFAPRHDGTRITYEARVDLIGLGRVVDPILHVLFQRVGSVAARGLRERIAERNAAPEAQRRNRGAAPKKKSPAPRARRTKPEEKGVA